MFKSKALQQKQNNSATKKQSVISRFCHITKYKSCWIAEALIVEHSFCKISIWLGIIYTNFLHFSLATFNEFSKSASSLFFSELLCFIALAIEIEEMLLSFSAFSTSKMNSSSSKFILLFASSIFSLNLPMSSSIKAICFWFSFCFF